jgi:hypothetical protein
LLLQSLLTVYLLDKVVVAVSRNKPVMAGYDKMFPELCDMFL